MKRIHKTTGFAAILCASCILTISNGAFAQDVCGELATNVEWNQGIKDLVVLVQNNRFDEAQVKAKQLSRICEKSPMLNYIQGKIAEGQENNVDARLFFQKASEYTYIYYVDKDLAQKIWYARYENEHPERSAKGIQESERQFNEKLTSQQENLDLQKDNFLLEQENEALRNYHALMWTGAGVGIAGLAMLGTGIGLYFHSGKNPAKWVDDNKIGDSVIHGHYQNKPSYDAAWGLIGSGVAMTVGGVLLTGIYGYHYTRAKKEMDYSITFAPNFATLTLAF